MKTSVLHGPLPPEVGFKFAFDGKRTLANARLESIAFHGAIVDVNLNAAAGKPALSEKQKQALVLGSVGLTSEESGNALNITRQTIKSQLRSTYRELGVSGSTAGSQAVGRSFETGIFVVRHGIQIACDNPESAGIANHIAHGGDFSTYKKIDGSTPGDQEIKSFASKLYDELDITNQNALVFFAYAAGWLPLQQEVEAA